MVLCFGIFAKILNCCKQRLPQDKFVPRIAWSVDRQNKSLASGLDYKVYDPEGMEGNKSVVSKLLSCKLPLVLRDEQLPSLEKARERFTSQVMPFINAEKVASAVLAILYVISQDETIETRQNEKFKKYMGMSKADVLRKEKFNVPDFLTRVLLYTTCVDNKEGKQFAKDIDDTFIEKATTESWAEAKYNVDTQIVEVIQSKEKSLFDALDLFSDLRLLFLEDSSDLIYGLLVELNIEPKSLFPTRYNNPFESMAPAKKAIIKEKMSQFTNLLKELYQCLLEEQKLQKDQIIKWPIHPGKRTREIYQQIDDLYAEIVCGSLFQNT